LLAACAAPQPVSVSPVTTLVPKCVTPRGCEALWIKAQDAASTTSGMKLRLVSDSRLETFSPNTYGRLGAVVTKSPQPDGVYLIQARFQCYVDNGAACMNQVNNATNLFNTLVSPSELPGR
jgi:hypothetical protein